MCNFARTFPDDRHLAFLFATFSLIIIAMPIDPASTIQTVEAAAALMLLVHKIIKAVQHARRFKKECRQLSGSSTLLLGILEKNRSVLERLDVRQQLNRCLKDCLDFVIQCQDWGRVTVFLEVVFRNRYPRLKHELDHWISYFNAEVGVSPY